MVSGSAIQSLVIPAAAPCELGARRDAGADGSPAGGRRLQLVLSPYYGRCDLSPLSDVAPDATIDLVSLADLLRNGFAYPPHSILEEIKLVTSSFDPDDDMHGSPQARFLFREQQRGRCQGNETDWVGTYHRLLRDSVTECCDGLRSPWLLQSGGKDSTSIAIAAAEARPDTTCITYLGGREEDEVASARAVARALGLRHRSLRCDPGRAYDRYLAVVDRMPLLTADFALLSYVDLVTDAAEGGSDGVLDGIGADNYFGHATESRHRWLSGLAGRFRIAGRLAELPLVRRSFLLCYMLSSLQMNAIERAFPGSRFNDAEVDALCGFDVSAASRARLSPFQAEMDTASSPDEWWAMASSIAGSAASVAKGLYTAAALSLRAAYPFCDKALSSWVATSVPPHLLVDPSGTNKVLMRMHIATRFDGLPYVARKGSFRFDLCGLARERFEQVHAMAQGQADMLPGATAWLERNRSHLDNKYHASKFYLLAVVLPWLAQHRARRRRAAH